MKFSEAYPILFQLFSGYFHDASFESLLDEDVVKNYAWDYATEVDVLKDTIAEINRLVLELDLYLDVISAEANVYFENKDKALDWLEKIRGMLDRFIKDYQ